MFQTRLKDINMKVFNYNLVVPMLHRQMMPYGSERELDRVCSHCDAYLPENFHKIVAYRNTPPLKTVKNFDDEEKFQFKDFWAAVKDIFGRKPT